MASETVERKLTTILSADVAGYSRLMEADEEGTLAALNACRKTFDHLIGEARGRIFGTAGDSVLAEFPSAVDAVRCALAVQEAMAARNATVAEDREIAFRIGINVGDVMIEGDDLMGDGVNVAARLQEMAEPGGICLSGTVYDHIQGKLDIRLQDLGKRSVKNIEKPVRVYQMPRPPPAGGATPAPTPPAQAAPAGPWLWFAKAAAAVLVIGALGWAVAAIIGATTWFDTQGDQAQAPKPEDRIAVDIAVGSANEPALALPDKPSIAVLPFDNLSGDAGQDYFADGITDELITALSRFPDMFVIARNSVFTYKGKAVKVQQVSRELGVRYVAEGSVQRSGDRVRINAQLIDATTGHHVWAERFESEMTDVFALQDQLVQNIVAQLASEVSDAEMVRMRRKGTDNFEAYDYHLRGFDAALRFTRESSAEARAMQQKAIELDPDYASAYAALAWTHLNDFRLGWSDDPAASIERAFELAHKAVSLDDSEPLGHEALSDVYLWRKDYDRAIAEIEKAIALNPNDADLYADLGDRLTWVGDAEQALGHIEKAIRLNPNFPPIYLWHLGHAYFVAERYDESIAAFQELRDRNPHFAPSYIYLAAAYALTGRDEEARAMVPEIARTTDWNLEQAAEQLPYKNPADLARLITALRQAGLTE